VVESDIWKHGRLVWIGNSILEGKKIAGPIKYIDSIGYNGTFEVLL
jgi:hypothetical protein